MLTVGVDLAAEAVNTAVARVAWSAGAATVLDVAVGVDDAGVLAGVRGAEKAGIDCPLGWPEPFVAFLNAHHRGVAAAPAGLTGRDWRRTLTLRLTDERVRAQTGLIPLSVSADRIAHPAMRCAGLLAALAEGPAPLDRSGAGTVVEVYPAAALRIWGLPHRGYKGRDRRPLLSALVDRLRQAAPWLDLAGFEPLCRLSDHAVDALVAALNARAAALGLTITPDEPERALARIEGWIALPTGDLGALVDATP